MTTWNRSIKVHQVTQDSTKTSNQAFELFREQCLTMHRPRIVLDCSRLSKLNVGTVQLLLAYLEEAMRYNGDVRLAALRPEVEDALQEVGISRIFEIYTTADKAVQSFQHRATSVVPSSNQDGRNESAEYAA